jgi:hypothetical protein
MITFKEYLEEALDSPVTYKVTEDKKTHTTKYDFEINQHHYRVSIIDFLGIKCDIYFGKVVEGEEKYGEEPVGNANARKVFSTVIDIIKEFIKKKDPKSIKFTADNLADEKTNRSRASFYTSLLSKYLPDDYKVVSMVASYDKKVLPYWKKIGMFIQKSNISKEVGPAGYTTFTLKKQL